MKDLLHLNTANDYARDIGAPIHHPRVSVVHYDEMGAIRHTLNRINVYAIFAQHNFPKGLTYGLSTYATQTNALLAYAPGQLSGKADDGTRARYSGWALLFDPEFIYGTEFERNLGRYHFFSYNSNEALRMTEEELQTIGGIMAAIRNELQANLPHTDRIVQDYILLLADYCNRFYDRQFQTEQQQNADLLARFQDVLLRYYAEGKQHLSGLPSVKYCAAELCMSPSYFGDVIRKQLGQSPLLYIRDFLIERAKGLIVSGRSVSEVAHELGFEYPQHFTRLFKKATGMLPSKYQERLKETQNEEVSPESPL